MRPNAKPAIEKIIKFFLGLGSKLGAVINKVTKEKSPTKESEKCESAASAIQQKMGIGVLAKVKIIKSKMVIGSG